jgi:hypothetical protein
MLHVDKRGIEACQPDDLYDLRVSNPADMSAQSKAALAQYALYPILFHASLRQAGTHFGIGGGAGATVRYLALRAFDRGAA